MSTSFSPGSSAGSVSACSAAACSGSCVSPYSLGVKTCELSLPDCCDGADIDCCAVGDPKPERPAIPFAFERSPPYRALIFFYKASLT